MAKARNGFIRDGIRAAVVAACIVAPSAHADTIATLSFTGGSWADGGSLSGYFAYSYDAADDITSILSVDITTGPGTLLPGGADASETGLAPGNTYIYNVSGLSDTTAAPDLTNPDDTDGVYEFEVMLLGSSDKMYLDWTGVGAAAAISVGGGGYYSSEEFYSENDGYRILESGVGASNAGSSNGSDGGPSPIVEPASLWLMLAGLSGLTLIRRKGRRDMDWARTIKAA